MRRALALALLVGCASPSRPTVNNAQPNGAAAVDYNGLLEQLGRADGDDRLANAYVDHGPDALLVATSTLLESAGSEDRQRGARFALMSLQRASDFDFIARFTPTPKQSCETSNILLLIAQSAQFMEPPSESFSELNFVPSFARRLVKLLDEPFPTCVERGHETGYSHPHVTALEILNNMVHWSASFDTSLARDWSSYSAETIMEFKQWWHANKQRFGE